MLKKVVQHRSIAMSKKFNDEFERKRFIQEKRNMAKQEFMNSAKTSGRSSAERAQRGQPRSSVHRMLSRSSTRQPPGVKGRAARAIAEDNTLDILYSYTSTLYHIGIPLTLTEKRTPEIRFGQDIEIWGSKDETRKAEELIHVDLRPSRISHRNRSARDHRGSLLPSTHAHH